MKRENRLQAIIEESWGYREYKSSWAGGNNSFIVKTGKLDFSLMIYKQYSENGKWSGNSGSFTFTIPKNAKVAWVGGLLTVTVGSLSHWFIQGRGMTLKIVEGYVYKGYHIPKTKKIKNFNLAVKKITKIRNQAAEEIRRKRSDKKLKKVELMTVWVSFDDSVKSGNCKDGTKQFIKKLGLERIGGIRADYLLELEDSRYTRRAVEACRGK